MAVFFDWNLSALAKAELAFNESSTLFGARHCVFIGLFNFSKESRLILLDALGLFVITNVFSRIFLIFGSQNCFFNESVCFFASSSL